MRQQAGYQSLTELIIPLAAALPVYTVYIGGLYPGYGIIAALGNAVDLIARHAVQQEIVETVEGFRRSGCRQVLGGTKSNSSLH